MVNKTAPIVRAIGAVLPSVFDSGQLMKKPSLGAGDTQRRIKASRLPDSVGDSIKKGFAVRNVGNRRGCFLARDGLDDVTGRDRSGRRGGCFDGGGEGEPGAVLAVPVVTPDGCEGQVVGVAVHHHEDCVHG